MQSLESRWLLTILIINYTAAYRNCSKTPVSTMPRFVLLHHDWPTQHHDLMIENEGVLLTWRLMVPLHPGEQHVYRIADHRLVYLDYEGPVSGDRGHVRKVARGNCQFIKLELDQYQLELSGELHGTMQLLRDQSDLIASKASPPLAVSEDAIPWRLVWMPSQC